MFNYADIIIYTNGLYAVCHVVVTAETDRIMSMQCGHLAVTIPKRYLVMSGPRTYRLVEEAFNGSVKAFFNYSMRMNGMENAKGA